MNYGNLEIVTDTHVVAGAPSETAFRELLQKISSSDRDVVFLGDIMDLWLAISRYETDFEHFFIDWCCKEKERRCVYFIEGNHEFYVVKRYKSCFTECSEDHLVINGIYFTHGHKIQGCRFGFNRIFVKFAKSYFSRFLMSIMPWGQRLALFLKRILRGKYDGTYVPRDKIADWLSHLPFNQCVIGHFHEAAQIEVGDKTVEVLPCTIPVNKNYPQNTQNTQNTQEEKRI